MKLPFFGPARAHGSMALGGILLAAALAFPFQDAGAQVQPWRNENWAGTWGAGPSGTPSASVPTFNNQTLRLIVRISMGGNRVRVRLSNEMGSTPLRIGAAHIAVRASGAAIVPGSSRALTFGGAGSITIPPGAPALSDPVELSVAALSDLAVSLHLPASTPASTIHQIANQTSYVSVPGNFTSSATLPTSATIQSWPFLTSVEVDGGTGAVVTLGDSITDGTRSTRDSNNRWPDWLARRLQSVNRYASVVNRAINGNRLLASAPNGSLFGRSALERFDRDVLATPGVRYLVVLLGTNDIGNSPASSPIPAAEVINGYRQLIMRAHARKIAVYGATLPPFEGSSYSSPQRDQVRQAVNNWIRSAGEFDGVIDFDLVLRDPMRHARLLPAYDSGDHLHPNDLGYRTMGNAVPLSLFSSSTVAIAPADEEA